MAKATSAASGNDRSTPLDAMHCASMDHNTTTRARAKRRAQTMPRMGRHSSGQARCTIGGKVHYLGPWGSVESHARYAALVQEWLANGKRPPQRTPHAGQAVLTVRALLAQYRAWIDGTGRYTKNGEPTSQRHLVDDVLAKFEAVAGDVRVAQLSEAVLVRWRDRLEEKASLTRRGVNRQVARLLRALRWARSRGLLSREVWADCAAIEPLKRGECGARPEHGRQRRAVTLEEVEAVARALEQPVTVHGTTMPGNRQLADLLRLQSLLGCRPGEACAIRWCDIDRTPVVVDGVTLWTYRVADATAKTAHHGRKITYPVPPAAQRILEAQPPTMPRAPIYSPQRSMVERGRARQKAEDFRAAWTTRVYTQAIKRACRKAGVPYFSAHEVRHGAITRAAETHGVLAAMRLANHSNAQTTAGYLHADDLAAYKVAARIG